MSLNSRLREIADKLPPMPKLKDDGNMIMYTDKVKVKGSALIQAGFIEVEIKGKKEPVIENEHYIQTIETPYMRNKFADMKEIHRKYGAAGVNEYIDLCFSYNELPNPGIKF